MLLKLILDCEPDAAWRALRSPTVFREVMQPFLGVDALDAEGLPTTWSDGDYRVRIRGGGLLPVGEQLIRLAVEDDRPDGVRILHDSGGGLTGALRAVHGWDHRMAVAPDPAGPGADGRVRTLYRDRLELHAGAATLPVWYSLWAFWQWRGIRLRALAPGWAHDPRPASTEAAE